MLILFLFNISFLVTYACIGYALFVEFLHVIPGVSNVFNNNYHIKPLVRDFALSLKERYDIKNTFLKTNARGKNQV